ncbi:MAG: hypothetical protein CVV64_07660 [Candidatus Wallbacteria bacterium HGW-Wallbacteria-1]|uniref:Uncharacterized protein n=1 Tax=Candidatus Wallbacteria bacterium HGW-Wallbacteria-1 TaxID=2013854 RepID=A0A2N1PQW9_9BACT|nr:MAG: hypothetical protein CVV64_07660 [Candidatus Wallbacteria bacterium HGW-Wallbacteria-1]
MPCINGRFPVLAILAVIIGVSVFSSSWVYAASRVEARYDSKSEVSLYPWERIELLRDNDPHFVKEPFHQEARQTHRVIQKIFGTAEPSSADVLLHFAPNWNKGKHATPILLVHGAGDHAFHGWCHPYVMEQPEGQPIDKPGMMQYLVKKGYSVFAVTFSHSHGCNFLQAQQIGNAIARIKSVLRGGSDFKVDIITHSKGAMPARIYMSDMGKIDSDYSWMRPYAGDVRKALFIGGPLKGLDTPFRYYAYNLSVMTKEMPAPIGADLFLFYGMYVNLRDYNDMFPGQFQMLHNWVRDGISFDLQSATPDMLITRNALYHGGVSALLSSRGIDSAIERAGNVIEKLNSRGVDPSIEVNVLAGSKQAIDYVSVGFLKIPVGEMAAESDGVVFLRSSTYTDGLTARGAGLGKVKVIDTHHVGLVVRKDAMEFVEEVLSGGDTDKKVR